MIYYIQYKLEHLPNSQWINYTKFENEELAKLELENFKTQFPSFKVKIYTTE